MVEKFSEEQIAEFTDCFKLFDPEDSGKVGLTQIGTVFRTLGLNPSEAELKEWMKEIEAEDEGVGFEGFLTLVAKKYKEPDAEDEIIHAFKIFDKDGNGFISAAELRHVMTTIGETLNDEEVDEMLREADSEGSGIIQYEGFIDQMKQAK